MSEEQHVRPVALIVAPFHTGLTRYRVGKGPDYLIEAGLADALQTAGVPVALEEIEPVDDFEGEIGRSFEVKRRVARRVAAALACDRFPLVLAGNCNTSVGVFAGMGDPEAGIVWFDAHPDFNTPDECRSGYFDGMGVATLAGQCWRRLAETIPGFRPFDVTRLVYCGIRDFEDGQREKVEAHAIPAVFGTSSVPTAFAEELDRALERQRASRVLVHLDVDSLDISVGIANEYAAPGGLSETDLVDCVKRTVSRKCPTAMTIASFNPDLGGADALAEAVIEAAVAVARAA